MPKPSAFSKASKVDQWRYKSADAKRRANQCIYIFLNSSQIMFCFLISCYLFIFKIGTIQSLAHVTIFFKRPRSQLIYQNEWLVK